MNGPTRRDLIKSAAILPVAAQVKPTATAPAKGSRPLATTRATGWKPVEKANNVLPAGGDPVEAVVPGVNRVEDDPEDATVGYGEIRNEEGAVELDAPAMDGRIMKSGAVAALHNIK